MQIWHENGFLSILIISLPKRDAEAAFSKEFEKCLEHP
jgi:hypothetical protein